MRKYFQGLTFANWVLKILNFTEVISGIQIRNLISQNRKYFRDLRPKGQFGRRVNVH